MAITDISIPLQYIRSGTLASRPDGQFNGQIFYATDTNTSYVWDGTEWQDSSVNLDNVNKLIGLNALNILDITAQASLTAGINANFERDIYTDSDGYLNTIDAVNTTALYNSVSKNYENSGPILLEDATQVNYSTNGTFTLKKTLNINPDAQVYDCTALVWNTGSSSPSTVRYKYYYSDATTADVDVSTSTDTPTLRTFDNPQKTKTVTQIEVYLSRGASSGTVYESTSTVYADNEFQNNIVQTDAQTIDAGFTKFMIVANEETTGTGSVTYDITFDSDAGTPTYQEDLTAFTEYTITEAGTSMILKQNLNAGASNGSAKVYNWGVLLW